MKFEAELGKLSVPEWKVGNRTGHHGSIAAASRNPISKCLFFHKEVDND